MKFQLGKSSETDDIINAARFLDALAVGSVIRNSCLTDASKDEGVYFVKMDITNYDERWSWQFADRHTYQPGGPAMVGVNTFSSGDIFLPVQVMRRGPAPEPETGYVKHTVSTTSLLSYKDLWGELRQLRNRVDKLEKHTRPRHRRITRDYGWYSCSCEGEEGFSMYDERSFEKHVLNEVLRREGED